MCRWHFSLHQHLNVAIYWETHRTKMISIVVCMSTIASLLYLLIWSWMDWSGHEWTDIYTSSNHIKYTMCYWLVRLYKPQKSWVPCCTCSPIIEEACFNILSFTNAFLTFAYNFVMQDLLGMIGHHFDHTIWVMPMHDALIVVVSMHKPHFPAIDYLLLAIFMRLYTLE